VSEDALLKPAGDAEPAVREAATAEVTATIRPAMQRLAEVLRRELRPLGRPGDRVGIREVPGGEAGYLAAVARHTTTALSPEEIHAIGLAELDELAGLWSQIGREAFGESDFTVIAARMRDDPALRFRTREEIIAVATDALARAEAARGTYFEHYDIPACVIEEINPIDADNTADGLLPAPGRRRQPPGAHCLLTTDPGERYRYEYEPLAFHESVPGHHLQLATAQTLDIPRYRRHIDAELCAFNEGWGLYAERLADEIGLYSDRSRGSGCCPSRHCGPAGSSWIPACTTSAGRASRRSTSCTTTPRPPAATCATKSTGTSPGRARRSPT